MSTNSGSNTASSSDSRLLPDEVLRRRRRQYLEQSIVAWLLRVTALISVLTTIGIVLILVVESVVFFSQVSVLEFVTGR